MRNKSPSFIFQPKWVHFFHIDCIRIVSFGCPTSSSHFCQPLQNNNHKSMTTQPETPQTCCKLWILPACCKLSTSGGKSAEFIKSQQICENQTCYNLIFAEKLVKLPAPNLWIKSLDNQLAATLLTTHSKLVTIKPEGTHPDIGLMTARQQAYSRLDATCAFLAVYMVNKTLNPDGMNHIWFNGCK